MTIAYQALTLITPMSLNLIKELHYTEFYPTLERPNHNSLVIFYSTRCNACRRIKTIVQNCPLSIPTYFINATSAGHLNSFAWDERNDLLTSNTVFYDLSYGGSARAFLKWSFQFSRNSFDGTGMLISQAAHSFNHWFKIMPNINKINIL